MNMLHTPLHGLHREFGATMTVFAGYEMPVRYAPGTLAEHLHTRAAAGLFDVSHMGVIRVVGGADLYERFERLVPGDIRGMQPEMVRYTHLLNARGGVVDDLLVLRPTYGQEQHCLLLIVNAAGKARDEELVRAELGNAVSSVELLPDLAILALQGPKAAEVLARHCAAPGRLKFMQCGEFIVDGIGKLMVSRSGYTGEDGFEIILAATHAEAFARTLIAEPEVMLIGLGARDTLRLEAGLPLYGHDLDETTTPVEAGLAWIIAKRRREQGGFAGYDILRRELLEGPARRRVGVRPQNKAIAREGTEIYAGGRRIGLVTSGGFGPSVAGPIAMGYVETAYATPGTRIELIVRGKTLPGQVVALPFIPHCYLR